MKPHALSVILLALTLSTSVFADDRPSGPTADASDAIAAAARRKSAQPTAGLAGAWEVQNKAHAAAQATQTQTATREAGEGETARQQRVIFGTSYEDLRPVTEAQAVALRSIGFDVVRPTAFWSKINPKRDVYDWTTVDRNVDEFRAVGFEIVMTIAWVPAWASGGFPTYELYTDGCTRFREGATSVMEIEFDISKPWCMDPPHLEMGRFPHQSAAYQFGIAIGQRYKSRVLAWAIGNEPMLDIYWPPARLPNGEGMRRWIVELVEPMTRGIRAFNPQAQFVGPEADSGGATEEALRLERDLGLQLFDAHSFHPYPWNADWRHVFTRIDREFMSAVDLDGGRQGRAIWYSECGGMPDPVAFVREVLESDRDVAMISIGDFRQWFVTGTWDANAPVLNEKGLEMQKLIREHVKGRPMRRNV